VSDDDQDIEQEHEEETPPEVETTDDETATEDETAHDVEPSDGAEIDKDADTTDPVVAPWRQRVIAIPLVPVLLALGLLAAGGLTAWLYFYQYRPDQQTDAAVNQSAVNAARDGTVALLSYKPDTLPQDFANAKSHLTGDFLNYYDQFTRDVVTPAAKDKGVATAAQVVGAATSELHANSAVVMVFVNQASTSKERPDPSMSASTLMVGLTKVNGTWLINKFDPV
jgi:Mce-associated membrane protein